MIVPSIELKGEAETTRSLRAVATNLDNPAQANRDVESFLLVAAQARAPRRTGRLAASGRKGETARAASIVFGGPQVPYANPIHWGWPARNIKAQPFVLQAVESTEAVWTRTYEKGVQRMIDRETT